MPRLVPSVSGTASVCIKFIPLHSNFKRCCLLMGGGKSEPYFEERRLSASAPSRIIQLLSHICSALLGLITIFLKYFLFSTKPETRLKAEPLEEAPTTPQKVSLEETCSCSVLFDPAPHPATVDVIFVHGFNGNSEYTWRQEIRPKTSYKFLQNREPFNFKLATQIQDHELEVGMEDHLDPEGDKRKCPCWPREWLPDDLPSARVLALDYTTDPTYFYNKINLATARPRKTNLQERAVEMERLLREKGVGSRPIIWCAHSKGGLYIKQILVNESKKNEEEGSFVKATRGFMFMSVPHQGTWLGIQDNFLVGVSIEISEVAGRNAALDNLHKDFLDLYREKLPHAQMLSLVELVPTRFGILRAKTTPIKSAGGIGVRSMPMMTPVTVTEMGFGPFIGIRTKHQETCKPASKNCIIYQSFLRLAKKSLSQQIE